MTEQELHKLLEIQYLKGRLDELHKAFPTIIDLHRSRKLDGRITKYYAKLKNTDEVAYHLYLVEIHNQQMSKEKSQKHMSLKMKMRTSGISDMELINKIKKQIETYI